jgi:hypothetical protein
MQFPKTTKDRLRSASLVFVVFAIFLAIDLWPQTKGEFRLGLLGWGALVALYHCIAFDAVMNRSAIGMSILWIAVVAASAFAFYASEHFAAATIASLFLAGYTWIMLLFLRKQLGVESNAA